MEALKQENNGPTRARQAPSLVVVGAEASRRAEELSKTLDKPIRDLDSEPGRQVSGQTLIVDRAAGIVVIDSGRELTRLRGPHMHKELKEGDMVRARVQTMTVPGQHVPNWAVMNIQRAPTRGIQL